LLIQLGNSHLFNQQTKLISGGTYLPNLQSTYPGDDITVKLVDYLQSTYPENRMTSLKQDLLFNQHYLLDYQQATQFYEPATLSTVVQYISLSTNHLQSKNTCFKSTYRLLSFSYNIIKHFLKVA